MRAHEPVVRKCPPHLNRLAYHFLSGYMPPGLMERTCADEVRRPVADLVFQEQKHTSFNRRGVTSSLFDRMANRSGRLNCHSLLFTLTINL